MVKQTETIIYSELQGKFLNQGWNECNPFYVFKIHFEILRETRGQSRRENIPRNKTWKGNEKFPYISPEFPQGNYQEISAGMIPWNSPLISVEIWGTRMARPLGTRKSHFTTNFLIWMLTEQNTSKLNYKSDSSLPHCLLRTPLIEFDTHWLKITR